MAHQNRYTSSNYDLVLDTAATISTVSSEFNNLVKLNKSCPLKINEWYDVIPSAVYYKGHDELIFKDFYIIIYEDLATKLLNSVFISRLGEVYYNSIPTDKKSKYYPAVENLSLEFHKSNVRRVLAVSCLRAFSMLESPVKIRMNPRMVELDLWDETTAGLLANKMKLIVEKRPSDVGLKLMDFGFLETHFISSAILDIVYSNETQSDIDDNNKLVFSIGEQLDQLFDPLTEYSPEPTEKVYHAPNKAQNLDGALAQSVCQELLQFQKSFTTSLVDFLQNYVLPLRIKVLNGGIKGYTTSKLNVIFPPTIDEVTRINCIYLDALKLALPYGSYEVVKASGMTIPYFYKAYMRHEAATKNFNTNLKQFLHDLRRQGIDEDLVFTKQKIESIIHGSLNLTKIKLILNRLIASDHNWDQAQRSHIPAYLESSTVTIDSFAKDNQQIPYHQRVFTPTGKILTELANGWPTELQYGWLTRRVVAIYDVENLKNYHTNNNEVMVIFSDHILFLKVNDPYDDSGFHRPSISDILMHSLINESPINNISSLSVSGWANIQGIQASTYLDDEMLKIFVNNDSGITNAYSKPEFTRYYRLSGEKKGTKVIELINKAKILNKTQPFHLFKTKRHGLTLYSTAHDFSNYNEEIVRSPFAVFLKMAVDYKFLVANNIFFALSIFFENDLLLLKGNFVKQTHNFVKRIKLEELSGFLCGLMSDVYEKYLDYNVNTADFPVILDSATEVIDMIDAYISDRKPMSDLNLPQEAPKKKSMNRTSLDLFTTARNVSDSSVIHRKKTGDTHRSSESRKSVGSNFSNALRRRSSNEQNRRRSNSLVKTITKVFKSKENMKHVPVSTVQDEKDQLQDEPTISSSFYDDKGPETISSKLLPKTSQKPTVSARSLKPDPIMQVTQEPLSHAKLRTSHSVRRKLSKLMDDLHYNYYDDGEQNWRVYEQGSTTDFSSDVQIANRLPNEASTITRAQINGSPSKHYYRSILEQVPVSPQDEKFLTPIVQQESILENSPAISQEVFQTPYEEQQGQFDNDSFNITFDDEDEEDLGLNVIDINVYDSLATIKKEITEESATHVADILEVAPMVEEEDFQSPFGDDNYEINWGSESESESVKNEEINDIHDEESVLINDDYVDCEPEVQQFTYKNTEDYQPEDDSTIINQIQLSDITASDFTMSSDSQQDNEEELRANLTWYSPSQLDLLMRYEKPQTSSANKQRQFTSKINIVQPPIKEEVISNKKCYIPNEDSVRFDEPILRASSYSYLVDAFNDDAEFQMSTIQEDALETTVMYDNKLVDNLKESSVKYLAGYIRNDVEDYSDIFELV